MSAAPAHPPTPAPPPDARDGLYASILGPQWAWVHETVRRMHDARGILARGFFRIEPAPGRLARLLARLGGLPRPSASAPVELVVTTGPTSETWRRTFGADVLVTTQTAGPDGRLQERFGLILLTFRLEPRSGGLFYVPLGASLQAGPLRLPLPPFLSPNIAAFERPAPEPGRILITVDISLPIFGRIMVYDGWIQEHPR